MKGITEGVRGGGGGEGESGAVEKDFFPSGDRGGFIDSTYKFLFFLVGSGATSPNPTEHF